MPYITESTMGRATAGRGGGRGGHGHGGRGGRGRGGSVVFLGDAWPWGYWGGVPPCVPGDPRPQCYQPYGPLPLPAAVQGEVESAEQAGQAPPLPVVAPVPGWTTAYFPVARATRTVDAMADAQARDPRLAFFRPRYAPRALVGQGSTQCPTLIPTIPALCEMAVAQCCSPSPLSIPPGAPPPPPYHAMPPMILPPAPPPTTPIFQPPVPGPSDILPPVVSMQAPVPVPVPMPPPPPPAPPVTTMVMPPQPVPPVPPPPFPPPPMNVLPPAVTVTAPPSPPAPPPPLALMHFQHPPRTSLQGQGHTGQRPLVLSYGYANPAQVRAPPGTVRQFALGPAERVGRNGRIQRQDPRTGVWL